MSEVLESLKKTNGQLSKVGQILDSVHETQDSITSLIDRGIMRISGGAIRMPGVEFKTIHKDGATITIASYPKKDATNPEHFHLASVEYLVCSRGRFLINIEGAIRVLDYKECASIPAGTMHICKALVDNSELVAVCIPIEIAYAESMICQR